MAHDHETYLKSEIMSPIWARVRELLRLNKIDPKGRLILHLSDWQVEFRATYWASRKEPTIPIGQHHYQKAIVWIGVDVDGLPVQTREFQFSIRSFVNPELWYEAIEGSAFTIYRIVEPVLEHGFCQHCNLAFSRNEDGGLLCGCIAKAAQDAE